MKVGVHLPLMEFRREGLSVIRLREAVDAAREHSLDAISANDHLVYSTPWLDGPAALAAMSERSGEMTLATTVSLPVLRGPVQLAKALVGLDILSEGRLVAGVGPGSSRRDYDVVGIPFEERWSRFDESVAILRTLLRGETAPATRYYELPETELAPAPYRDDGIPIWIGSWGSDAGLRRVARLADGWLASAYNTSPDRFAAARGSLAERLAARGRDPEGFPNALVTMWTWVSEDEGETTQMLEKVLAPLLRRDPDELREHICIGSPEHCAQILSAYAQAGCEWVQLWPLGEERRQIELLAESVIPALPSGPQR
jgi:alkanesulfonate monooxygenase SsuD/methylene tetrahydromethanopterin reductase-like flavin-dependent oxidoreductase (luciferase family)